MSDLQTEAIDDLEVTPARLRKLLGARVVEGSADITLVDRRTAAESWRAFASSTLFPLAVGLATSAAGAAFFAARDVARPEGLALAFAAAAVATAIAALIAAGRRAVLPALVFLVLAAVPVAGNIVGVHELRREDEVALLIVAIAALCIPWLLSRTAPPVARLRELLADSIHPGRQAEARALTARPRALSIVAAVIVTALGAPLLALTEELARNAGEAAAAGGLAMIVVSAVLTRRTYLHLAVRQLAIVAGVVGTVWLAGSLARHLNVAGDQRELVAIVVVLLGIIAVASLPVRVVSIVLMSAFALAVIEDQRITDVERADDVVFILLAVLATFSLTRPRMKGARAIGTALVLLMLAAVEISEIGRQTHLALGTASGLGAIACLVALSLVVTRGASTAARGLVAGLAACTGFLLIDAPAVLGAILVVALARHARVRTLELVAAMALGVFVWARAQASWGTLDELAGMLGVAAAVVAAGALTLRRLPQKEAALPSGLAGIGSAAGATSTAAPSMSTPPTKPQRSDE